MSDNIKDTTLNRRQVLGGATALTAATILGASNSGQAQPAAATPDLGPSQAPTITDVRDKVAYITGGSSGIGLGIAKDFFEAGMKVVIGYVSDRHLEGLGLGLGHRRQPNEGDVSAPEAPARPAAPASTTAAARPAPSAASSPAAQRPHDPMTAGRFVLDGILHNDLYIVAQPEWRIGVEARATATFGGNTR